MGPGFSAVEKMVHLSYMEGEKRCLSVYCFGCKESGTTKVLRLRVKGLGEIRVLE